MTLAELGAWWAATVLPWAIDSTLVGLILLGLLHLTQGATPAFRNTIATLGLAKMALPPQVLPVGLLSMGVVSGSSAPVAPLGAPLALGTPVASTAMGVVAGAHLLGVAAGLLLLIRRVVELQHVRQTGHPAGAAADEMSSSLCQSIGVERPPLVIESKTASAPFIAGLFRPTVVLPHGLAAAGDAGALRGLLAHELLHLRRGDVWMSWARALVLTFWWPSPLVRALARAQERAIEELCDDAVLGRGLSTAREYANSLLTVATLSAHRGGGLVASAVGAAGLEGRILRFASPAGGRMRWTTLAAILALTLLLLPASTTGRVSATGLTTSIHFEHGESHHLDETGRDAATAVTGHRHNHNH